MMKIANKPIIIFGAGLAGLTVASFLKQKRVPVLLCEADARRLDKTMLGARRLTALGLFG